MRPYKHAFAKPFYVVDFYRFLVLFALILGVKNTCYAKVIPAACFTDNMVLQQKTNATIWGTGTANKPLTITTSWNSRTYTSTADATGNWKLKVATPSYGGPYTITFNDGEVTKLSNVLIGEVWVCSGQSNMEMPVSSGYGDVINIQQELADAANYPQIRMLKIGNNISFQPRNDVRVKWGWNSCNPQTVKDFSAAAYFFAKNIYDKKHIPIGIINSTWGGTVIEAWTSGDALKSVPAFAPFVAATVGMDQAKMDARNKQDVAEWLTAIDKKDPAYQNGNLIWAQSGYNDAAWPKMTLPTYWEQAGIPDFDGTVWFRKKVSIPANWIGKTLQLNIEGVDDYDISFFNGIQIGHSEGFYVHRNYTIDAKLIKPGENTIAVRVFDAGGLGGINKGPLTLSIAGDTTSKIDLSGEWTYQKAKEITTLPPLPAPNNGPNHPTLIYNAMIHPILPYTIKGVIWYQGESNADRAYQYRKLMPLLITDWRNKWNEGNFPFYFVQIANYSALDQPKYASWPELREAQLKTLSVPNTGMAVTIDIGDTHRIHPQNKQEVGRRLALIALAKTYGDNIPYSGPMYLSQKVIGNKIELSFSNTNNGLSMHGDNALTGFTIAGADKKFYPATAIITGNKVMVSSADVSKPVAVRYAWENDPKCNLYNGAGLPASPFRTDDWPGITFGRE